MKTAKGPRPWSVHLYAAILLLQGGVELIVGLLSLGDAIAGFELAVPWVSWNADLTIITLSATFTIVLIPVIAVWLLASSIARIVLTVMAVLRLPSAAIAAWLTVDGRLDNFLLAAGTLIAPLAVALLYTPSASRWLRTKRKGEADASV